MGESTHIDWLALKDRLDLAAVVTNLLGMPPERHGARILWHCPFHADEHPSFYVNTARKTWRCWPCAVGGDAADLVMRVNGVNFAAALKFLADFTGVVPGRSSRATVPVRSPRAVDPSPERSSGLPLGEASALVSDSIRRLWGPQGEKAMAYLHSRGLSDETIETAGLGFTDGVMLPTRDGDRAFRYAGIVIPWKDEDRLTKVKIRRLEEREPKYAQAFADHPLIYPGPDTIQPGLGLIVCEGEFDALLLGQILEDAAAITLGSASARSEPDVVSRMLSSPLWAIALDADKAGDTASAKFPARGIRVRPPEPFNDWTKAAQGGLDLRGWWRENGPDFYRHAERLAIQLEPGPA